MSVVVVVERVSLIWLLPMRVGKNRYLNDEAPETTVIFVMYC